MNKLLRLIRYDWPLHFVLLFTNWLPDNVPFLKLRGTMAKMFFLECGANLRLGRNLTFYNPANVRFGKDVYIAYGTWLSAGAEILIEDEVMFGPYCVLVSGNHTRLDGSYRFGAPDLKPITVGKGSWLGAHVTVTGGSKVGEGSLVAAGAVIAGSFPPSVLLGGVPAKIIKVLE